MMRTQQRDPKAVGSAGQEEMLLRGYSNNIELRKLVAKKLRVRPTSFDLVRVGENGQPTGILEVKATTRDPARFFYTESVSTVEAMREARLAGLTDEWAIVLLTEHLEPYRVEVYRTDEYVRRCRSRKHLVTHVDGFILD